MINPSSQTLRENNMRQALEDGRVLAGMGLMYPAPGIIESTCGGFDFVWIDGQHGQISYDTCIHCVRTAAAAGVWSLVRVPSHDGCVLGPFADMAPDAMMIPMVNSKEEAEHLVGELTFAPSGRRSYGGRRVVDVGTRDFHLQKPPVLMMQIETLEAVDNVEAIAATEGVDCLFYGPDDMRVQCGLPMTTGVFDDERLLAGLKRTAEAARKVGKWCGTVCPDPKGFQNCLDLGYQVLVAGADIGFLRVSAAQQQAMVKDILGKVGGKTPVPSGGAGIY